MRGTPIMTVRRRRTVPTATSIWARSSGVRSSSGDGGAGRCGVDPGQLGERLGLTRPFVTCLLDDGEMPWERVPGSKHRRVRLGDLLELAICRDRRRDGPPQDRRSRRRHEGLPY